MWWWVDKEVESGNGRSEIAGFVAFGAVHVNYACIQIKLVWALLLSYHMHYYKKTRTLFLRETYTIGQHQHSSESYEATDVVTWRKGCLRMAASCQRAFDSLQAKVNTLS
jgi:hypothetical protein